MSDLRERLLKFRAALKEWPGNAAAAQAGLVKETIERLDSLNGHIDSLTEDRDGHADIALERKAEIDRLTAESGGLLDQLAAIISWSHVWSDSISADAADRLRDLISPEAIKHAASKGQTNE